MPNFFFDGQVFKSCFQRSRRGDGWVSVQRIDGRPVIIDAKGMQPKDDGKEHAFRVTGENGAKKTVYFGVIAFPSDPAVKSAISLRSGYRTTERKPVIVINAKDVGKRIPAVRGTDASAMAMTITITKEGTLKCFGPGTARLARKPRVIRRAEPLPADFSDPSFRHGSRVAPSHTILPGQFAWLKEGGFETHVGDDNDFADLEDLQDWENADGGFATEAYFGELQLLEQALPNRVLACTSCGDYDCACDGTHTGHHRAGHNTVDHVMA